MGNKVKKIKEQIKKVLEDINKAEHAYLSDPDYVSAHEAALLAKQLAIGRSGVQEKWKLHNELKDALYLAIEEEENKIPQKVSQMCKACKWGTCSKIIPIWWTDDLRFVLFKDPGHYYWAGIGSKSYAETSYFLIDSAKFEDRGHGLDNKEDMKVKDWNHVRYGNKMLDEVKQVVKNVVEGTWTWNR